ncbi:MAG: double-strand break repair helicase AddA [Xanthobacteraceae bacterium]|nr:double-strand break repair helicase AddA [Xanthobacteraceae bacterium]
MSAPRSNIPDAVREAQTRASDPDSSVFVAANAGSGKTHVLVNRVIRLLLNGVPPEKILCITFTKAAAANMAERVFTTLGRWVTLSDDELGTAIHAVGATVADAKARRRARTLFACALETPGGLKVQTIHALCTRLLQQFPFESNVPAHFAVLDDRDQNDMMERANLSVLLDAARAPNSAIGHALDVAMTYAADVTFKDVVREACLSRDHFMAWSDEAGSVATAMAQVCRTFGIDPQTSLIDVENEIVDGPFLPRGEWLSVAAAFETGSSTDAEQGTRLRAAAATAGAAQVDAYLGLFMTGTGTPRKTLMTKPLAKSQGSLAARLDQEQPRVVALIGKRRAVIQRDRTQALLVIANGVSANYRREKLARGLLDYDDLIDKTHELLTQPASAGWVHYKLDRGIDHVLIDEAQDTSPRQWDIIERLIEEFPAGEGARDGIKRTVFAVGDEKQSIFSFQGAAPREFDNRRGVLERRFRAASLTFEKINFNYSFRSGEGVLRAVSSTFQSADVFRSVTTDAGGMPPHMALSDAAPALVDLWNLEEPQSVEEIEGWDAPFDAVSVTSPEVRLARRIEAEIKSLITQHTVTGTAEQQRRLRYGDVLILVRRRGQVFDAVIQSLKRAGIPVAGADRLKLTEHIAVIDLMNLADALLQPHDDLALAVALKSPLFGLTDDDLLSFAPLRTGTLRDAFVHHAQRDATLKDAFERLDACEQRFAQATPFAFFAWLLGGDQGRARILKRLGLEANDALDEFLELALTYERKAPASLQGFMAWLRAADTEVKRDMEITRDEVRVMTVHGSKGLEASVVFLVDTTTSPADTQRLNLIRVPQGNAGPNNIVIWAGKKDHDHPAVAAARGAMKQDTEDEYRRLLYVAMTRAAERLVVGGCQPGNRSSVRELSWYDLIQKGLTNSGLHLQEFDTTLGHVRRYTRDGEVERIATDAMPPPQTDAEPLPQWLHQQAGSEPHQPAVLRPSDGYDAAHRAFGANEGEIARMRAIRRGSLIHRLLQSLPDVAASQRKATATTFLQRNAGDIFDEHEQTRLADQVIALIGTSEFANLFGPDSRAEVSIAGRIETRDGVALVSGQIDRLVIGESEIMIVDYKTNHAPPDRISDVPSPYLKQLALYRAVLRKLYANRTVRCALLWTETATIMEIPSSTLDAEGPQPTLDLS